MPEARLPSLGASHRATSSTPPRARAASWRLLAPCLALLSAALLLLGCGEGPPPEPTPGIHAWQERSWIDAGPARVNTAGGNLLLQRRDLSIDTRVGEWTVSAVWNSATRSWGWNFEMSYDGGLLVDDSGARLSTAGLAPGDAFPGTRWVYLGPLRIKSLGGRVHEFDSGGRLSAVYWTGSPYPRLVFSKTTVAGATRISAIDQCTAADACSPVVSLARDAEGRVVGLTDRADRRTEYGYDLAGRLSWARDALAVARGWPGTRYAYDQQGRLASRESSENELTGFAWAGDRVSVVTHGTSAPAVWRFACFRSAGLRITVVTEPEGHLRSFAHDDQGRLREILYDSGDRERFEWDGFELAEAVTPSGAVTRWSWPAPDRLLRTDPSGNEVEVVYALAAQNREDPWQRPVLRRSDSLGPIEEREYDANGRLLARRNALGEELRLTYDADGNIATRTSPLGQTVEYLLYGEHGHAESIRHNMPSAVYFEPRLHDAVGNLVHAPLATGELLAPGRPQVVDRQFDENRNVAELVMELGGSIRLEHRSDGQLAAIRRPHGGDSEFVYDDTGSLIARNDRVDGSWQPTWFHYDERGRLRARSRPNGMSEYFEYSSRDEQTGRSAHRDGVPEQHVYRSFEDGLLRSQLDSSYGVSESFEYDDAERIVRHVYPGGEEEHNVYDLRSRLIRRELLHADGSLFATIEWDYDLADRWIRLRVDGVTEVEREIVDGRLVRKRFGNGVEREFERAPEGGHLLTAQSHAPDGTLIEHTIMIYLNVIGKDLTAAQTETWGSAEARSVEEFWIFDYPDYHGASLSNWSHHLIVDGSETERLQLQACDDQRNCFFGSMVAPDIGELGYEMNAERNRMLVTPFHQYSWDEAGFATSRDETSFEWSAAGRLTHLGSSEFRHDLDDRPITIDDEGLDLHFRFGGQAIAPPGGPPVALELGDVAVVAGQAKRLYRHFDFRGNVKFVTDESGDVRLHYVYGAYGIDVTLGDGEDNQTFAKGTRLGDDLYLLGRRLYDGSMGRFLAPDPVYQVVNQYTYAEGNPLHLWDPSGLVTFELPVQNELPDVFPPGIFEFLGEIDWTVIIQLIKIVIELLKALDLF